MKKIIQTSNAPKAVGPYSQAIYINNFIFCSGQIGINPKTNEVVEGIEKQTLQVLNNIKSVLKAADSDMDHVVKTTIYLSDINTYQTVNELYGKYFIDNKPARTTVEVSRLPKNALIEIDAIAVIVDKK